MTSVKHSPTYHLTCDDCGQEVNASETDAHARTCEGPAVAPRVDLDLSTFTATGPEGHEEARRLGTLEINGVPMHVEAYRVHRDESGAQVGEGDAETWLAEWYGAAGADGPFTTFEWEGAEWVLFLSPYC